MSERAAKTRRPIRSVLAPIVLALLWFPAATRVGPTEWNLHLWGRLRNEHKMASDAAAYARRAATADVLPREGPVGLVYTSPPTTDADLRAHYFLQYVLAPRVVVRSADPEFVFVSGARRPNRPVLDPDGFVLIREVDDDLALYRRVARRP